jgi:phage terminase small subunit
MALNERQQRFVNEYLIDLNATRACIRAGYSEKTAHSQGPRLLENVGIKEAIRKAQQKTINKLEITREDILQRAYMIPLLYSEMLELAQRDDLDEDEELRLIRLSNLIKGSDHNKALEILNKMQGFNEPEKIDHTSKGEKITINLNLKNKND